MFLWVLGNNAISSILSVGKKKDNACLELHIMLLIKMIHLSYTVV